MAVNVRESGGNMAKAEYTTPVFEQQSLTLITLGGTVGVGDSGAPGSLGENMFSQEDGLEESPDFW